MAIFNSLGSNYDLSFVVRSLFSRSSNEDRDKLKKLLSNKYDGNCFLYYKGRDALKSSLISLSLPKNSAVAINGFTCFAVYEAIVSVGLIPVYLDIAEGELNFSSEILKKATIKHKNLKVVVVQNTLGYPCEVDRIKNICDDEGIILIEDLAHSVGTKYQNGKETGRVGDMVVLSFSQDKEIDGITGGALVVRSKAIMNLKRIPSGSEPHAEIKRRIYPLLTYFIRNLYPLGMGKTLHGFLRKLNALPSPVKLETGEIRSFPVWCSGLVLGRLKRLRSELAHRKKIARIYSSKLNEKILLKKTVGYIESSSNNRFPILISLRSDLIKFLERHGIYVSDIWYDAPVSPKRLLKKTNYNAGECPRAEAVSEVVLNLPTHLNTQPKDAIEICILINSWQKLQQN